MDFKNKKFLFVGDFRRCVDKCVKPTQMVEMAGGCVKQGTSLTKDVDYLVIGEGGSDSWKDGICPQKEKALEMKENGLTIEILEEKALFENLAKAGISEELWLAGFNKRLSTAYDELAKRFAEVDWSYDKANKTLTVMNAALPSWLDVAEDADIVGYAAGGLRPSEYYETASLVGFKEYDACDLRKIVPWAEYVEEMEVVCAPSLIEVPLACFAWSDSLRRVELPSARVVRSSAFYECKKLNECFMPKVVFIDGSAFENCHHLQGPLHLREVEFIGECAFRNCFELTKVYATRGNRVRCDGKSISIQGTALRYVGDAAFANCSKFKGLNVKADASVVYGRNVYMGCGLIDGEGCRP